jgi:hypothetical protein
MDGFSLFIGFWVRIYQYITVYQFVTLLQGTHGLRQGRQQADDALRGLDNLHLLLAVIEHDDGLGGQRAHPHGTHQGQRLSPASQEISHAALPTG